MDVVERHRRHAVKRVAFGVAVVSSSRFQAMREGRAFTDETGVLAVRLLEEAGHKVLWRRIVGDKIASIREIVYRAVEEVDALILCGGTGVSPDDVTVEAVSPLFSRLIPGFGELFRQLSYGEIGSAAMLSRAMAGMIGKLIVFLLPGSPGGVKLAIEKLILPEIGHMVALIRGVRCD